MSCTSHCLVQQVDELTPLCLVEVAQVADREHLEYFHDALGRDGAGGFGRRLS